MVLVDAAVVAAVAVVVVLVIAVVVVAVAVPVEGTLCSSLRGSKVGLPSFGLLPRAIEIHGVGSLGGMVR